MKSYIPSLLCDFYKVSHRPQYPQGTEYVYSTWTPRTSRVPGVDHVVAFGFQGFITKYLIHFFNENFFSRRKSTVIEEYRRYIKYALGDPNPETKHMEELYDLGYLPVLIKALPEGTLVPLRVPMLTIENTDPRFFWVTNYLETLMSCELWLPSTSATTAYQYRKLLQHHARLSGNEGFVQFQGHDFSMRGMGSVESASTSGAGHLLSFVGTDTIPAISFLEFYYDSDIEKELVGCSVAATEHSVMCAGGAESGMEYETYRRLIEEVYPTGIVSIVSDTWDLWYVLTRIIPDLKEKIMNRNGKVVIRPDSGDPVKIICGDFNAEPGSPAHKGVVELLWETFGGTVNEKGFKELDSHIGAIYGDAITLTRAQEICSGLTEKGFASTNVVFGIGSYTYQYVTRDTFGFALKSTHCVINGEDRQIFKDPKTDDGVKKSLKGRVAVIEKDGDLAAVDGLYCDSMTQVRQMGNLLRPIFEDGKLVNKTSLAEIRARLMEKL